MIGPVRVMIAAGLIAAGIWAAAPAEAAGVDPRGTERRSEAGRRLGHSGVLGSRRPPGPLRFAPREVVAIADLGVIDIGAGDAPAARDGAVTRVLAELGLTRIRSVGPIPRAGSRPAVGRGSAPGNRAPAPRRERFWVLTSDRPGFDPAAASAALRATGAFRAVCPNYRFPPLATYPDDLFLIYQWYVDDGGFADIHLPLAWDVARGDTSVAIAIIDTGVDTTHPDLAGQIWRNTAEIPGNGLDDEGNGLIDDVEGWDFGWGDGDPKPEYTPDDIGIDVGFHGTFCAGIAAAATYNGDGIAGAGWNCRIMPIKISHPDSGFTASAVAGAFAYAADNGASVISMSFGSPGDPGVPEFYQALVDMAAASGSLCVAAAGNAGDSLRIYPAGCDGVLSVAATDFSNARASFSNYGSWVDVAAPGSTMWSTIAQNYTLSELDQLFYILLFGWDGLNPYMYGDGTSFSCPLTAGVCGLVRARYPSLTPALVMQHLIATGDAVAYDLPIGVKVNAFSAVSVTPTAVAAGTAAPGSVRLTAGPNPISRAGSIRFTLPAAGPARLALYDPAGRRIRTLFDGTAGAGPQAVAWDGRDERGAPLPAAVYFARLEARGVDVTAKVVLMGR